jgi:hypothetical protein
VNQKGPGGVCFRKNAVQGNPYPLPPLNCQSRGFIQDEDIVIFKKNRYSLQVVSRLLEVSDSQYAQGIEAEIPEAFPREKLRNWSG